MEVRRERYRIYRIRSPTKREGILRILHTPHPSHFERVYLAGFLKFAVGMSTGEIIQLIKEENKWKDYNPKLTYQQINSIKKEGRCQREVRKGITRNEKEAEPSRGKNLGRWIGVVSPSGFVMEWYREGNKPLRKEV